jgi:hypothetical protein
MQGEAQREASAAHAVRPVRHAQLAVEQLGKPATRSNANKRNSPPHALK